MKVLVLLVSAFLVVMPRFAQQRILADPPEVRGPLTLSAVYDAAAGHNEFAYAGKTVPPVLRVSPGRRHQAALCKQPAKPFR